MSWSHASRMAGQRRLRLRLSQGKESREHTEPTWELHRAKGIAKREEREQRESNANRSSSRPSSKPKKLFPPTWA